MHTSPNEHALRHTSMARKQASSSSKSPAKMEKKRRSKTKTSRNAITINADEDMEEIRAVSSPSSDSMQAEKEDAVEEASDKEDEDNDEDEELVLEEDDDDEQVEEESVAMAAEVKSKKKEGSNKKKSKDNCNGAIDDEPSSLYRFPMQRVSRIIKSEDPGIRITQEAVFAINKASEKFLQLFSMEAYACAFLDRKKFVAYKHLSSVVTKRKRFDFLSDFIPEKLKAEDALNDILSMDTS